MNPVQNLLHSHPQWAAVQTIYHRLSAKGYRAFLAGGCVRDALLGLEANDLDIATDATPDQIENLFEKTVNVGKVFGVMRVLIEGADIEVATFRTDGNYADGRRPDTVTFSSPEEDAQRRDFTINALFFDLKNELVLDYVGGQNDLSRKLIRTVGEARRRFQEDHLRLLRGARFSAQLDFDVAEDTIEAMKEMAPQVKTVSGERLRDEMGKLLKSKNVPRGLAIMNESNLMAELFPARAGRTDWPSAVTAELWQNLSLFFREFSAADLKSALDILRLSVKERRATEDFWNLWQNPAVFFEKRQGQQLQAMQKPGVEWALNVLAMEGRYKNEIDTLMKTLREWNGILPKPFLNGEDLKGHLQGEAIGHCLQEAYCLQLEGVIHGRDEAVQWLQNYLKSKGH